MVGLDNYFIPKRINFLGEITNVMSKIFAVFPDYFVTQSYFRVKSTAAASLFS
jgi:hypothetical protein